MKRKKKSRSKKEQSIKDLSNVEQVDKTKMEDNDGAGILQESRKSILMGSSHGIIKPSEK